MLSVKLSNSSILPIDKTLSGATTPGQGDSGDGGNEEVLRIPQNFSSGASPSDSLVSYQEHSLGESYLSAEIQSVYFIDPAGWARLQLNVKIIVMIKLNNP